MKYLFLFFILFLIILLSTFYCEGYETYVMKNALVNTTNGNGRLYTIDTDGNFSESRNRVDISAFAGPSLYGTPPPIAYSTTVPIFNTTTPPSGTKTRSDTQGLVENTGKKSSTTYRDTQGLIQ